MEWERERETGGLGVTGVLKVGVRESRYGQPAAEEGERETEGVGGKGAIGLGL